MSLSIKKNDHYLMEKDGVKTFHAEPINIHLYSCLSGARAARGVAVLFDVFRASNTIIACLEAGAVFVRPVGALEEAYRLKEAHPEHLLFGERGGLPPVGFDGGNSPVWVAAQDLRGKGVLLTTSAGSQGIVHANGAETILIGSFLNLSALAGYLQALHPPEVSLIAMGLDAREPAEEDEAAADGLRRLLLGRPFDFRIIREQLLHCSGADRLRRLGQEDDLAWCLTLDRSTVVPQFDRERGVITAAGKIGV